MYKKFFKLAPLFSYVVYLTTFSVMYGTQCTWDKFVYYDFSHDIYITHTDTELSVF